MGLFYIDTPPDPYSGEQNKTKITGDDRRLLLIAERNVALRTSRSCNLSQQEFAPITTKQNKLFYRVVLARFVLFYVVAHVRTP